MIRSGVRSLESGTARRRPTAWRAGLSVALALGAGCGHTAPASTVPSPAALITPEALRRDVFALAAPAMRGREAGTVDELRGAAWIAERAREAGLEPAGDGGTYLQLWPMRRTWQRAESRVALGDAPLRLLDAGGGDVVVVWPVEARVDLPLVWVGEGRERDVAGLDLRGRAVAAVLSAPTGAPPVGRDLMARRYAMLAVRERAAFLARRGAAAVVLVADSTADGEWRNIGTGWMRGDYAIDSGGVDARALARAPVLWLPHAWEGRVRAAEAAGARLTATLAVQSAVAPSVNVVARAPGRDSALRGEVVLYSGHVDGLGVRYAWNGDSVWAGADDNASTDAAMLAIGRAFVAHPGRRSVLFVWHGAEEPGLLGSRWFVAHPTVPRDSIVAVLNGDMIGRNAPDSAALLGATPPNRTSRDLVAMALAADATVGHFAIDSSWDRPGHPESFFHRSDHWPYVQAGIPAVYFTAKLHPDYHTPRDTPERIDYAKLARMARWMEATGRRVADADERPRRDGGAAARE